MPRRHSHDSCSPLLSALDTYCRESKLNYNISGTFLPTVALAFSIFRPINDDAGLDCLVSHLLWKGIPVDRDSDKGVVISVGLIVALLVTGAGLTYWNTNRLDQDAAWVAHAHAVLDLTGDVLLTLVDAETGQRGFLLTGQDEFLQPYNDALAHLDERLETLKDKTRSNIRQQNRLTTLQKMADEHLRLLRQGIELRRKSEKEAQAFVASGTGKKQMDAIRNLVAEMEREEDDLLKEREARSRTAYQIAVASGFLTAFLGLVLMGAFLRLLRQNLLARQRATAAAAIQEQQEWFRTTLASIGDAVIATDTEGKIVFLNAVASNLTGWEEEEATRQALDTVFQIVNEKTGQPAENPVTRVFREGHVVGLGNHTLLISRRGDRYPIDDSASPIRNAQGHVAGAVLVFRDASARRASEAEVAWRASFPELNPDPICEVALDGQVHYLNPAIECFFPDLKQKQTQHPWLVNWEWVAREFVRGVQRMDREIPIGRCWFQQNLYIVEPAQLIRIYGMDITDRKRAEEALQEADRRKDEFLAVLAHELRDPLAPIRNAVQIMRLAGDNPQAVGRAQEMMDRQLQHMVRLVDDLLDVSRITRGKIELRKERIELAAVVNSAVETSRPTIEEAGHELTVVMPPEPIYLEGDLIRLAQVVANLLNNSTNSLRQVGT